MTTPSISTLLTNQWTSAGRWVCLCIKVKGLQDNFAVGAVGKHKSVSALYTHPSFDMETTQRQDDVRNKLNSNQPHLSGCRKHSKKIPVDARREKRQKRF